MTRSRSRLAGPTRRRSTVSAAFEREGVLSWLRDIGVYLVGAGNSRGESKRAQAEIGMATEFMSLLAGSTAHFSRLEKWAVEK